MTHCGNCNGSGKIDRLDYCRACKGTGLERLSIDKESRFYYSIAEELQQVLIKLKEVRDSNPRATNAAISRLIGDALTECKSLRGIIDDEINENN